MLKPLKKYAEIFGNNKICYYLCTVVNEIRKYKPRATY